MSALFAPPQDAGLLRATAERARCLAGFMGACPERDELLDLARACDVALAGMPAFVLREAA